MPERRHAPPFFLDSLPVFPIIYSSFQNHYPFPPPVDTVLKLRMNMTPSTFVKIALLDNAIEAQLVDSVLKDQDIPHMLRSYYDTAYDGLFQVQKGWGEVQAPAAFKETILEILESIRSEDPPVE